MQGTGGVCYVGQNGFLCGQRGIGLWNVVWEEETYKLQVESAVSIDWGPERGCVLLSMQ